MKHSPRDYLKKLKMASATRISKKSKSGIIASGRFAQYLKFLDEGSDLMVRLKGHRSKILPSTGVAICHEKSIKLGLIKS